MKNSVFAHVLLSAVAVILTACGGTSNTTTTTQAPIPTISVSSGTITLGQSIQLSWNCGTGTTDSVSGPGMTTSNACAGTNVSVTPTAVGNATYTISSTNSGGSNSASTTVTVNAAPKLPVPTISGTSSPITLGQSIQLSWNCDTGTTSSVSGPGMTTSTACTGTNVSVTPPAVGSNTYTISSTNSAGTASASYTVTVNAPVTVLSVSIALTPTNGTVAMGSTLTCTGTVTYSNTSTDSNVTYTASNGTITSSGVFSPTATGPATCTAIAVKDSTKSATGNITVTAAPIVISSISPNWYFTPTAISSPVTTITGSGFAGGELFYFSGYQNPGTVSSGNPATTITYIPNIQLRPRFINVYGTQADGTGKSNTVAFATLGIVPIAAACSDYIFADDQGDGIVRRFSRSDGSHVDLNVGGDNGGIATDCNPDGSTNFVLIAQDNGGIAWYDKNGNGANGGVAGDGNPITGIAANNHVACTIEPIVHEVWCTKLVVGASVQKFSPAIGTPEALSMTSGCGGNTLFVLDAQGDGTNLVLYSFVVGADGTLSGEKSVTLPGFTAESHFTQAEINNFVNWQVAASQTSCTAAVMAPVLNAATGTVSFSLAIVNGTTMTETTPSPVALPSGSFLISEDDVHSATLVYVADVSGTAGVSRMWSRPNTASGALTQLSSTTSILDAGPILSPDGNTIYATGWDPLNDSAGLQLQSVPNK